MNIENLLQFFEQLKPLQRVVIQAHDFPDHDAISSAYGLSFILQSLGMKTLIVYNGEIDRISLSNMVEWLNIPVVHCSKANLNANDHIITVDGCIGEKNVTDLPGDEIAVIDHHTVTAPSSLWFSDIRPSYGATATIIFEYYQMLEIDMPMKVATALLVGLNIDTANLTRGFCNADLKAFITFNQLADLEVVNKICRNSLIHYELANFEDTCKLVKQSDGIATVLLKEPCAKNMLGVLADFLLSVNEFDVVIVAIENKGALQLSLRSECLKVNVAQLLRKTLNDTSMGFGGGHSHMAGGIILADNTQHFMEHDNAHFAPFVKAIKALQSLETAL
ncbi:MAG: nanoRNase/pAp phosphatase (c-di-AMP/oligoRNAs hydrolase) [Moritella dasanensis]|jgi:nanoRNase/pAp phosphatase (c-di-AMP/oligoRNAs hydrolase)